MHCRNIFCRQMMKLSMYMYIVCKLYGCCTILLLHWCLFILTGESLVIRTQLHLLIMLREHLDNHLNSITEERRREGGEEEGSERGREGGREWILIKEHTFQINSPMPSTGYLEKPRTSQAETKKMTVSIKVNIR